MIFTHHLETLRRRPPGRPLVTVLISLLFLAASASGFAQQTVVGGIARSFTLTNRRTGQPLKLTDFAGKVVVLDFFAYWCGPCQQSSPDLKANVDDYYSARGGNAHGVPVVVVSVNIESQDAASTDAFINGFGLNLVADDLSQVAYYQFSDGYIPLFVIINGVPDSPSGPQWEVMFENSGYPGAPDLRAIIDTVEPSDPTAPARVLTAPVAQFGRIGESATFDVHASGAGVINYQWFKDDQPIDGQTGNSLVRYPLALNDAGEYKVTVSNAFGSDTSTPVALTVFEPGVNSTFVSTDVPKAIPDYPQTGITSVINVQNNWSVIQLGVQATINHTWIGDLYVMLTSPSGTTVTLKADTGEPGTQLNLNLPDIRDFIGEPAQGVWFLSIWDLYGGDVGTLISWTMTVQHPADKTSYLTWAATFPGINLADPSGDQDGDGIPNLLEFLMADGSPQVSNHLPSLEPDSSDSNYFQFVVPLRPNTQGGRLAVELSPTLNAGSWSEAVTSGNDVIVDKSVPDLLKVRLKKSLGSMYVRLKGVPQ